MTGSGGGRAAVTVSRLEGWNPTALDEAGMAIRRDRDRVREHGDAVRNAATSAITRSGWRGMAADGARRDARRRHERVDALTEAAQLVSRAVLTAADTLGRARSLLEDARSLVARHGLVMTEDGTVLPPPPVMVSSDISDAHRQRVLREYEARAAAATQAEHMAKQALATAAETDADAAAAVRRALAVARDSDGARARAESAMADLLEQDIPPAGSDPAAVSVWWEHLSDAARARLLAAYPERLGNLDGIPYPTRIEANQVLIRRATDQVQGDLDAARARLEELQRDIADGRMPTSDRELQALGQELGQLHATIAESEALVAFYTSLTADQVEGYHPDHGVTMVTGRQVVLFDPENGRFAEVIGPLHPGTRHVGLLVGGTGTNLMTMDDQRARAEDFVEARERYGDLAMITYLGGPMPQNVLTEAPRSSYALDLAPGLRDFAAGVDRPAGATLTAAGHSYGGSVVGAAEAAGMEVDRVLHIASAGAGPGVHSPEDYAAPGTPRYSITAPGDFIEMTQGRTLGSAVGHGADPDVLDGVVRLESGLVDHTDPTSDVLSGSGAHSGVFARDTTAWQNMFEVMTGGEVMLYTWDHAMRDPAYVPPTEPVR